MPIQQVNSGISMGLKGLKSIDRFLKTSSEMTDKALNTAIRVEAFKLSKTLKADLKKGSPGGRDLRPLTFMARRAMRKIKKAGGRYVRQSPNRAPLARMATGVRYKVARKKPFTMEVGFVTPHGQRGGAAQGTWRFLAKQHQEGFTTKVTPQMRKQMVGRGAQLGTIEGGETPFFLRKETTRFETPARPIVTPFWARQMRRSPDRIKRNFKLKLKGVRI